MRYIFWVLGTVLAILFMVQLSKGKRFSTIVENLDSNEYPLSSLYCVGFAWGTSSLFRLKGEVYAKLRGHAVMLYEPRYADYYANLVWAQTITLVHFFLAITFLLATIMYELALLIVIAGIFMSAMIATYCLENMKNTLSKRTEECERDLPEVVSTMAILVNSGMVLREAWHMIGRNGAGALHALMRQASDNMENGYSDADAIFLFGKVSNSVEIKKFTSALLQSMEKGGAELSSFLARQSSEMWNAKRQRLLQSGEKAAAKLLLPIVLIFVGIIIIVLTAAFAGSLF